MILTDISAEDLPEVIERFAALLEPSARAVFRRIADPAKAARAEGAEAEHHHAIACELARDFGMKLVPGSPALDYAWTGTALRRDTEAYVLLHEVAHYQLAPPERQHAIDFGLGAGPETGDRDGAERAATVFGLEREKEEAMASLLGVLWETELGQPGFASFIDQNWLEGADRPGAAQHFTTMLKALQQRGLVDEDGRPRRGAVTAAFTSARQHATPRRD
jgi:DNA-binding transcriptional ArsR family regulator